MNDEFYMQRCLELALMGMGKVSPNPMVGCVIVNENQIIGEGYHQKFGEAHAEVNAVEAVIEKYGDKAVSLLRGATVYVNLEPCAHFGKTPPCADLLVKHQVKRVVIANTDPFADVNGKGIAKLKAAGIATEIGILANEAYKINRRFFTRISFQRPFIILKWAQTADGYFAPEEAVQEWISGNEAKMLVHKWRSEEDAILVGKKTVLIDNPSLTTRNWPGKNPIRIVIDRNLTIPSDYHIFDQQVKTIVFNEIKTDVINQIHYIQMEDMHFYLAQKIAFQLYLMDIQSVIIEGGHQILTQFISSNLWDEARIFTSNAIWGKGKNAPQLEGRIVEQISIGTDQLTIFSPKENI